MNTFRAHQPRDARIAGALPAGASVSPRMEAPPIPDASQVSPTASLCDVKLAAGVV
jgi:hypothetical protein